MTGVAKDWLVIIAFFAAFFVFTFAEAAWINKRAATNFGRALFYAFTSNILFTTLGLFISFAIMTGIMMMAWDGSLQSVAGGNVTVWAAVVVAALAPLLLLVVAKRLLLNVARLEIPPGRWAYPVLASIAFFLFVFGVSVATAFVL